MASCECADLAREVAATPVNVVPFVAYRNDPDVAKYQSPEPCSVEEATALAGSQQGKDVGMPGDWYQIAIACFIYNANV